MLLDSNLTGLTILLRGMLNSSSGIRPADNDPLDICYRCGIGETNFQNDTTEAEDTLETNLDTTSEEVAAFVPLEDRHCTKMICRYGPESEKIIKTYFLIISDSLVNFISLVLLKKKSM